MPVKIKPLTKQQLFEYFKVYRDAFPDWAVENEVVLVRLQGPIKQCIAFEALRGGAYRPSSSVEVLVSDGVRILFSFLDIKNREILPRDYLVKWPRIVKAMEEQFVELCRNTSPVWGSVRDDKEYWTKVMTESPVVSAIGRDFGKYLPGLFWMNFLGKPYVNLIEKSRLASTPSLTVQEIDEGLCLKLYEDPFKGSESLNRKSEVQYFFQRENKAQETASPWTTETSRN